MEDAAAEASLQIGAIVLEMSVRSEAVLTCCEQEVFRSSSCGRSERATISASRMSRN